MAGRCGCASAPATGAALTVVGCLTASGAGTPASPFLINHGSTCLHVITCSSGLRPASPAVGQVIFETDTGEYRRWNGSRWRLLFGAPTNHIQDTNVGAALAGATLGDVTVNSIVLASPWQPDDTVSCAVRGQLVAAVTAGDTWDCKLFVNGGEQAKHRVSVGAGGWAGFQVAWNVQLASTATATVDMRLSHVGGPGNYQTFNGPPDTNMLAVIYSPD